MMKKWAECWCRTKGIMVKGWAECLSETKGIMVKGWARAQLCYYIYFKRPTYFLTFIWGVKKVRFGARNSALF